MNFLDTFKKQEVWITIFLSAVLGCIAVYVNHRFLSMPNEEEPTSMSYFKAGTFSAFLSALSLVAIGYFKDVSTSNEVVVTTNSPTGLKQDKFLTGDFDA